MVVDGPATMTDAVPSPIEFASHSTSWTPSDGMTPVSTAPSRKRSRDETAFEAAEVEGSYFSRSLAQEVKPPEPIPEEPIYGEGMVLLNPSTGRALSAESQTGTWYEDKVDEEAEQKAKEAAERPKMPVSRKSVRMSQSSIRPTDLLNGDAPASPPKAAPTAEIDEATIALGIGWTKMSSADPDLQAAARGWARYLEVHYPGHIHGAEILLKNNSLDAYLVGCQEGFFLFAENLLQGQMVGRTWEIALANLRSQPIQFEGVEVLQAERTPGPELEQPKTEIVNGWKDWNRVNGSAMTNGINGTAHPVTAGGMDLD